MTRRSIFGAFLAALLAPLARWFGKGDDELVTIHDGWFRTFAVPAAITAQAARVTDNNISGYTVRDWYVTPTTVTLDEPVSARSLYHASADGRRIRFTYYGTCGTALHGREPANHAPPEWLRILLRGGIGEV